MFVQMCVILIVMVTVLKTFYFLLHILPLTFTIEPFFQQKDAPAHRVTKIGQNQEHGIFYVETLTGIH